MTIKTILIDLDFRLEWQSPTAKHSDNYYVAKVDLKKDYLANVLKEKIATLKVGENYTAKIQAKDFLGESYSSNNVIPFDSNLFDTQFKGQLSPAILYRFYPKAIAWQGLDATETDYSPFRLISVNNDEMSADCNHPLAKYYLTVTTTKVKESEFTIKAERPDRSITQLISSKGPGMQAPFEFGEPVFFDDYPFKRPKVETLKHSNIDSKANHQIEELYSKLLSKHSKVLDLMSTDNSHLSSDYQTGLLTGLGENEKKLAENQRLDTYEIQDLNTNSALPFADNSFDDAICTLSIEYLTKPLAVFKEITRVVNSGGKFIVIFSNDANSDQAINLWPQLHPFERMQLVLEYYKFSGLFTDLNTFTQRGLHRHPEEIKDSQSPLSDPIYAVWGTIK